MTIQEVITQVDALQPNDFTAAQKIAWLDQLDRNVYRRLVRRARVYDLYRDPGVYGDPYMTGDQVTYRGIPYTALADNLTESPDEAPDSWQEDTFAGYTVETDTTTDLLAPEPYDEPLYTSWLLMQMDLFNREIDQYNNHALLYNTAWDDLARHLKRTFMPIQEVTHFRM
jgi:hypothetical protein